MNVPWDKENTYLTTNFMVGKILIPFNFEVSILYNYSMNVFLFETLFYILVI